MLFRSMREKKLSSKTKIIIVIIGVLVIVAITSSLVWFCYMEGNKRRIDDGRCLPMSSISPQTYNSDYEIYIGTQIGSTVRTFLSVVSANNSVHRDDGMEIKVNFDEISTYELNELIDMQSKIVTTSKYRIEIKYNEETGRVNEAIITEE